MEMAGQSLAGLVKVRSASLLGFALSELRHDVKSQESGDGGSESGRPLSRYAALVCWGLL